MVGTLIVYTLIVASIHGLGPLIHRVVVGPEWVIVIAIVLPAAAASLAGC